MRVGQMQQWSIEYSKGGREEGSPMEEQRERIRSGWRKIGMMQTLCGARPIIAICIEIDYILIWYCVAIISVKSINTGSALLRDIRLKYVISAW